ncbi:MULTISPECIES: SlyX family protein [Nitrospirillum]|uniref:Protein SlyX homolog n=1 Tax=Nitrospirillum amazonense TaxID=28077 RepID=A0A560K9A9_9PROT|nr:MULTISPECIES: SlyX family protein [Nitrospirillum]EGX99512.1 Protein slyX [Nitrospirillum amazonense Y2]MDG3441594.1 SlyX family protein [Nitrospirillum amazonense]MEA1650791.1 SlyX family protein [Nitrospirillum sp. BR 11164]MEC4592719.1 SlyX family protein [Nitrospirillum amazonense]TWB17201.1 SlyX protein [Nitrospirillum amazonense]
MDSVEQRLIDLEMRITHHERMAEELSQVVADQGQMIDMLTARVRRLLARLQEAEGGWRPSPQDEKPPPHY